MAGDAQANEVRYVVGSAFGQGQDMVCLPLAWLQVGAAPATAATLPLKGMLAVLRVGRVFVCLAVRVGCVAFRFVDRRLMVWAVVANRRT